MRLFVAIDIDEATRAAVAALVARLQRKMKWADVKWVPAANLHVTLQFIGHVDDAEAARIREALAPPVAAAPFEMRVHGIGAFPERGGPRVIWCGVGTGAPNVAALQREIERRLVACGAVEPESRPYAAHLTIGRYRSYGSVADRRLLDETRAGELGRSFIDRVTLYESRLSPHGPTYLPIAYTALSATIDRSAPC